PLRRDNAAAHREQESVRRQPRPPGELHEGLGGRRRGQLRPVGGRAGRRRCAPASCPSAASRILLPSAASGSHEPARLVRAGTEPRSTSVVVGRPAQVGLLATPASTPLRFGTAAVTTTPPPDAAAIRQPDSIGTSESFQHHSPPVWTTGRSERRPRT